MATEDTAKAKELRKKLRGTETKIERLYAALADGTVGDTDMFRRSMTQVEAERDETLLLNNDDSIPQLLLSDLLGHAERIWGHFVGYAKKHEMYDPIFRAEAHAMAQRFQRWKVVDRLCNLPAPP